MLSSPRLARLRAPLSAAALALLALLPALAVSARAEVSGSVLHEFIPPDPSEDVTYSATTLEGDLPAALQTPSGLATAPDPRKEPAADHVYSGATSDDGPDSSYEPDRDTRRPHVENYDDPFSPGTAPFKRLHAYDWVDADYSLHVRDKALHTMSVGGAVAAGDEAFYGDMSVDLIPGQPVRIPTVGPGARVLRMHDNPEVSLDLLHDGTDNWFVRGTARARVRLVMELAIPRDTFGRELADVDWSVLDALEGHRSAMGALPPNPRVALAGGYRGAGAAGGRLHEAAFNEVAQAVGISRALRPREVVRKMVDYFRSFSPSEEPPSGRGDIYLDLSLSKKGVCRHRAFAFLVTALGIGIPTRMVVNEAHAWVEVYDSKLWHRIDLGGAAANLDADPDPSRPPYLPPPDPYAWPTARDSGQDLADRNRAEQQSSQAGGSEKDGDGGAEGTSSSSESSSASSASSDPTEPRAPEAEVSVAAIDGDVHRGLPLHLQGQVQSAGSACPHLRVDVVLVSQAERSIHVQRGSPPGAAGTTSVTPGTMVGSLSTDERGRYDGAVVLPHDLALGDYDLVVQTPGDARCGAGRTK